MLVAATVTVAPAAYVLLPSDQPANEYPVRIGVTDGAVKVSPMVWEGSEIGVLLVP